MHGNILLVEEGFNPFPHTTVLPLKIRRKVKKVKLLNSFEVENIVVKGEIAADEQCFQKSSAAGASKTL